MAPRINTREILLERRLESSSGPPALSKLGLLGSLRPAGPGPCWARRCRKLPRFDDVLGAFNALHSSPRSDPGPRGAQGLGSRILETRPGRREIARLAEAWLRGVPDSGKSSSSKHAPGQTRAVASGPRRWEVLHGSEVSKCCDNRQSLRKSSHVGRRKNLVTGADLHTLLRSSCDRAPLISTESQT